MRTFYSVLCCTLIYAVSISQESKDRAQDSIVQKTVQLDEILITGNAVTDPVLTKVSNDYQKNIVQPKNIADLFDDINGFSVIKRGSYAIDPSFRASQYEQLNVQYDGGTKAMYACPNRMDPITTHVIPEEVSKIEIIKGPYTVRYGTTFGGVINIVTNKPRFQNTGFHGKASGGYESNGNSFVTMLQLQQVTDRYDLVGNVDYRNFGNYKDGNKTEIPSSFKSTDYGLKFGYNLTGSQRLQVRWSQTFGRDVLHAGLPMDTDYANSSILSLDYKWSNIGDVVKSFIAKAYYSYVDHLMSNKDRPSFMMTEAASSVNATTMGGKFELNWKPIGKLNVFSGMDLVHIARNGGRDRLVKIMNGNRLPMPMVFHDKIWQDSYIDDVGLFTEAKWSASPSTIVTVGVRTDMVVSDIKDPEADFAAMYNLRKRTEQNVSGTVSIKKIVSDKFMFEAAFGRGVRSANMIERFINHFTVGQDSYEYIGNPNLKAEINNQFEIGFKGHKDLQGGFNLFKYTASFYYSIFDNYIVAVVDPYLTRKYMPTKQPVNPKVFQNLDNAYKTGFELMGQLDFLNNYFVRAEAAYVYAKNKDLNESLPLVPPFNAALALGYEHDKIWANIKYRLNSKQSHISKSFGEMETPGYATFDCRFGIKPYKNVSLGVAVLNVFDKTYHNHLNFSFNNQEAFGTVPITEPGRNITFFLEKKF